MTSLSNRALLVSVSVSEWSARKLDKTETQTLKLKHGLNVDAARVNKNLLPLDDSLERIRKATNGIRAMFYERTLPWAQENMRILKADAYMKFAADIGALKREREQLVDEFIRDYPARVAEAQRLLNGLFKRDDYPEAWQLRDKFACKVNFAPVPDAKDWRVDVGEEHLEALRQQLAEQERATLKSAMAEAWDRVKKVVEHAHERLAQPEAVFRNSLVDNALELCALLPALNIENDPGLDDVRRDLESALVGYNVETLRTDPVVRQDAAQKMADIMSKMGALYAQAA